MRFRRLLPIVLILLGAAAVYWAGIGSTPLIDRDEPRYAQTSKQMLESGNWVVPYFLDTLRLKKPIFIYWCQAGSMKLLGPTVFAARLPSVIAFILTLAMLAVVGTRFVGVRRATWALFMLATCVLSLWAAKTCLTDAVLLVWMTIALLCLAAILRVRTGWGVMMLLGLSIGFAFLTKGPVVLMFLGMTGVVYWLLGKTIRVRANAPVGVTPEEDAEYQAELAEAEQRAAALNATPSPGTPGEGGGEGRAPATDPPLIPTLSRHTGRGRQAIINTAIVLACALVVLAPWAIALELRRPGSLLEMLSKEVVDRGTTAQENHTGPPGFYLVTLLLMWFPWILLLPATLLHAWKRRRRFEVRFALAAIIGPWIFLEIYKTKLPHYLLPSYPFLALLTADLLLAAIRGRVGDLTGRAFLLVTKVLAVLMGMFGVAALVVPWLIWPRQSTTYYVGASLLIVAYLLTGLLAARHFSRLEPKRAALVLGLGTWAICGLSWTLYFPNASFLNLSSRIADVLKREGATSKGDVLMVDYKEGSLAFYQGGTIREQNDEGFMTLTPPSTWPKWLVTTRTHFEDQRMSVRDRWETVDELRGFNVAEAKLYDVLVLRKK
ncbi:MAG: glycosyltransferase family 39 protein [Tepidisphaeraceae bacterium]